MAVLGLELIHPWGFTDAGCEITIASPFFRDSRRNLITGQQQYSRKAPRMIV